MQQILKRTPPARFQGARCKYVIRIVNMQIRNESESDINGVWRLNSQAFPTVAEADLVDAVRSRTDCISLVAEIDDEIVGHILFSPVQLSSATDILVVGLAPMAVLPDMQNSGIGSTLVQRGLSECRVKGIDAVAVLGHPNYYPRFGFKPSVKFGIKSEYDVPDDVFMIQELTLGSLKNVSGIIKYNDVFNKV